MKISDLRSSRDVRDERLKTDPEFAAEWRRTEFGRQIAVAITAYRSRHNLTQDALGELLGMHQPAVARLEEGEHNPTVETLRRVVDSLRVRIAVQLDPDGIRVFFVEPVLVEVVDSPLQSGPRSSVRDGRLSGHGVLEIPQEASRAL